MARATLVRLLVTLGYQVIRECGSHIRVRKTGALGEHNLTVPDHGVRAKGTLNDILMQVSLWNNIPKERLAEQLR